jgi:hypothetical protein
MDVWLENRDRPICSTLAPELRLQKDLCCVKMCAHLRAHELQRVENYASAAVECGK